MPNSLKTETEDHPGPLGAVAILPPVEPPEDLFSAQPKAGNQSFLCTLGVSFIPLNFVYLFSFPWFFSGLEPQTDTKLHGQTLIFYFILISIVNLYHSVWVYNCFTKKETNNRESRSEESSAGQITPGDTRQGSRNRGLTFQRGRRAPASAASARSFCLWHSSSLIEKNNTCWAHCIFLSWGWLRLERMVSKTKWPLKLCQRSQCFCESWKHSILSSISFTQTNHSWSGLNIQLADVAVNCTRTLDLHWRGSEITWRGRRNYYSSTKWNCRPLENFVSGFRKESIYSTNTPLAQVCWAKATDADFHDDLLRGFWSTQILCLLQPWSGANHPGLEWFLAPYFRGPFSPSQPKRLYSFR